MKPLAIIASLFFALIFAFAAEPPRRVWEGADHPKDGFVSLEALRKFAETSSFGGGSLTTQRLGEHEIHVVDRCFTSGEATTELSIYVRRPNGDGFYSVLFQPIRMAEIRSKVVDDAIVFEQYDQKRRGWVTAMTLTKHFFER